jgi:Protein of unknown function (DUF3592)
VSLGSTTSVSPKPRLTWQGFVALLGFFAGLCTIFAFLVTVAEAWQEHNQAQWPETTARIEKCGLRPTSTGRRNRYYIDCRLSYAVGADEIVTKVYSRNVPSPQTWQYPPNQIGPLEEWVDEHPQGTTITVHYDPRNPEKLSPWGPVCCLVDPGHRAI